MSNDSKYSLSRRKALLGLGTVGVAGAGAGVGTSALFSDTESFEDNTLTAGELNLIVDYGTSVDSENASAAIDGGQANNGENDGDVSAEYVLGDVKPGDGGSLVFCPKVVDNPAWLWAGSNGLTDSENGLTEPEGEVDSTGGDPGDGNGELSENIQVTVSYCEYTGDGDRGNPENYDTIRELNNPDDYTLADLIVELQTGFLLDGDDDTSGTQAYPASEDSDDQAGPCLCIDWEIPMDVGNEIQSDSVEFDIAFAAEQERNNPDPESPFVDTVLTDSDPSDGSFFTAQVSAGPTTVVSVELDDSVYTGWPNNPDSYQLEVNIDADTGDDGTLGENGTLGDAGNDDFRFGYAGPDGDPGDSMAGGANDGVNGDSAGGYLRRNIGTGGTVNRVDVSGDNISGFTAIESSDQRTYTFVIDWDAVAADSDVPDLPSAPSEIVINEVFGTDGGGVFGNPAVQPTEASGTLQI